MARRRQWHPTPVLLPGKSHGWRSLVGCSPWGRWGSDMTEWLHFHFSVSCIGEGNGNPLQCSCLENPRDGGAWWAAVYGVTQSWTQLKRLNSSSSKHTRGFPDGSAGKESTCNARDTGDVGLIPRSGRSPGGGHGNLLQYSCLENPMDSGTWWATVQWIAKNQTWLSNQLIQTYWVRIAATSVFLPGKFHGQRSLVGCSPWGHRVGHNWATEHTRVRKIPWRREWLHTPIFLLGKSHGQRSLASYNSPWGHKE